MSQRATMFNYVTRDNGSVKGRSRIYFSCHKDDKEKYLNKTCKDLFSVLDCVIYYTDDMDADYSEELRQDLEQMNLFVIPVTRELLFSECRTVNVDMHYAIEKGIPILPLVMDEDLSIRFEEIFGKLHYLVPDKYDNTAIPYHKKLEFFLNTTLISDELRKRVQKAFDEYVFLSYRKKDRRYAIELMRLMHANPQLRRIAIWYDEYLVPGERYDKAIEEAMEASSEFMLLVTPHLLEDGNYVLTTEYPLAIKIFGNILPIEMVPTDRDMLKQKYPDISDVIEGNEGEELSERFINRLKSYAHKKSADDPVHNYLLGIAYLEGIDVEVDREYALTYIRSAAEADLPEAVLKLSRIYHDGIGVKRNWSQWLTLLEKGYLLLCKENAEDRVVIEVCRELAEAYSDMGRYPDALEKWNTVYNWQKEKLPENDKELMTTLGKLAAAYQNVGKIEQAKQINTDLFEKQILLNGEQCVDTLLIMVQLSENYYYLGNFSKAFHILHDANEKLRAILGDDNPTVIGVRIKLYDLCFHWGSYYYAMDMYKERYLELRDCYGEDYPLTIMAKAKQIISTFFSYHDEAILFSDLAKARDKLNAVLGNTDHPMVIEIQYYAGIGICFCDYSLGGDLLRSTYEKRKKLYGENHPETIMVKKSIDGLNKILSGEAKFDVDLLLGKQGDNS